jgi:hypothetical protein
MGALTHKVPPMNAATLELPTGAALEREIEAIEAGAHDERIRKTIIERIATANDPKTVFVPHNEVFSASKRRLLVRLTGNKNA